jgi:transposase
MRYVRLSEEQTVQLEQLYKHSLHHRERQRAQALLLSHRGYPIEQLAELFAVDRDTVSRWFDRWDQPAASCSIALQDQARAGRPSKLSNEEKKR